MNVPGCDNLTAKRRAPNQKYKQTKDHRDASLRCSSSYVDKHHCPKRSTLRLVSETMQVHVARNTLCSAAASKSAPRGGTLTSIIGHGCSATPELKWLRLHKQPPACPPATHDDRITKRMSEAAGVPAITSAPEIEVFVVPGGAIFQPSRSYLNGRARGWQTGHHDKPGRAVGDDANHAGR